MTRTQTSLSAQSAPGFRMKVIKIFQAKEGRFKDRVVRGDVLKGPHANKVEKKRNDDDVVYKRTLV